MKFIKEEEKVRIKGMASNLPKPSPIDGTLVQGLRVFRGHECGICRHICGTENTLKQHHSERHSGEAKRSNLVHYQKDQKLKAFKVLI